MTMDIQLARGIAALGLDLPCTAQTQLLAYAALLVKWNRVYNLTALREESQIVTHHLLDSLAVLPYLEQGRLADIGSGGGLPGIPLAIASPQLAVSLVETSHKKASFLQQAKIELALDNLSVVNDRVEQFKADALYDIVISRAFSDISDFLRLTDHLVAENGRWFSMKGVLPHDEIAQMPSGYRVVRVVELRVPDLDAARHLIVIERG